MSLRLIPQRLPTLLTQRLGSAMTLLRRLLGQLAHATGYARSPADALTAIVTQTMRVVVAVFRLIRLALLVSLVSLAAGEQARLLLILLILYSIKLVSRLLTLPSKATSCCSITVSFAVTSLADAF